MKKKEYSSPKINICKMEKGTMLADSTPPGDIEITTPGGGEIEVGPGDPGPGPRAKEWRHVSVWETTDAWDTWE